MTPPKPADIPTSYPTSAQTGTTCHQVGLTARCAHAAPSAPTESRQLVRRESTPSRPLLLVSRSARSPSPTHFIQSQRPTAFIKIQARAISPSVLRTSTVLLPCTSLLTVRVAGSLPLDCGPAFRTSQAATRPSPLRPPPSQLLRITKWAPTSSSPVLPALMRTQGLGSAHSSRLRKDGISLPRALQTVLQAGTLQPAMLSVSLCLLASATLAQVIHQYAQEASSARQAAHRALAVRPARGPKQELLSVCLVLLATSAIARTQSPSVLKVSTRSKTCRPAKPVRLASSAILALTLPRLFSSPVPRATTVLYLAPL